MQRFVESEPNYYSFPSSLDLSIKNMIKLFPLPTVKTKLPYTPYNLP